MAVGLAATANHHVGGYITYVCLGGAPAQYEVTLTLFTDCSPGNEPMPDTVTFELYNAQTGQHIASYDVRITNGPYLVPLIIGDWSCAIQPTGCFHAATYVFNLTLPAQPAPQGYWLTYNSCCRPGSLVNVQNPLNQGVKYYTRLADPSGYPCNSSPVFINWPSMFVCVNKPFVWNHSASDGDGDSLAYKFCNALNQGGLPPGPSVNYSPPYSGTDPIASSPAFSIDPVSGQITGTPTMLGGWVLNVCLEEWRNGMMIGEHHREVQINVVECLESKAIIAGNAPFSLCAGDTVQFKSASTGAFLLHWDFGTGNPDDTSIYQHPIFVYPDTGAYTVRLIANNGYSCADTAYANVIVGAAPPSIQTSGDTTICPGTEAELWVNGMGTFTWLPAGSLDDPNVYNPIASTVVTTTYTVTVQVSPNCMATDSVTVTVLPNVSVSFTGLKPNYFTTDGPDTLTPSPPGGTFSGPGITGNIFTPSQAGKGQKTITYTWVDTSGCAHSSMQPTFVQCDLTVSLSGLDSIYQISHPPVVLIGDPPGGMFSGDGVSGNMFNPMIAGYGSHVITYFFTDSFGCTNSASVITTVTDSAVGIGDSWVFSSVRPNPSNGFVYVSVRLPESSPTSVRILDGQGRAVEQRALGTGREFNEHFDLSPYGDGIYLVELRCGAGTAREHIVILLQ